MLENILTNISLKLTVSSIGEAITAILILCILGVIAKFFKDKKEVEKRELQTRLLNIENSLVLSQRSIQYNDERIDGLKEGIQTITSNACKVETALDRKVKDLTYTISEQYNQFQQEMDQALDDYLDAFYEEEVKPLCDSLSDHKEKLELMYNKFPEKFQELVNMINQVNQEKKQLFSVDKILTEGYGVLIDSTVSKEQTKYVANSVSLSQANNRKG